jgi:hypothetical protein
MDSLARIDLSGKIARRFRVLTSGASRFPLRRRRLEASATRKIARL